MAEKITLERLIEMGFKKQKDNPFYPYALDLSERGKDEDLPDPISIVIKSDSTFHLLNPEGGAFQLNIASELDIEILVRMIAGYRPVW